MRTDQNYWSTSSSKPIWKREAAPGFTTVGAYVSTSTRTVPTCTSSDTAKVGRRYRKELGKSANGVSFNNETTSNSTSWTLGMETPAYKNFTMSAGTGVGKNVTVTFGNGNSSNRRVLCITKPSGTATTTDGDFYNLNFTGSSTAQTSINPGLIIGIDTFAP